MTVVHFLYTLHVLKNQQLASERPKQKEALYKTNRLVELLSKVVHFFVVKIGIPGIILPKAIFSYYKYVTTDVGNDAFELAVASW